MDFSERSRLFSLISIDSQTRIMNTGTIIYLVLTFIALFPLAGIPPFTLIFSAPSYPRIVRQTYKFKDFLKWKAISTGNGPT